PSSRHKTLYLDGIRGIAALIVYIMHLSMVFDRTVLLGFIPGVSDAYYNVPVLRLFRSGKAMVRIFFVLSGYALTISPATFLDHPESIGKLHRSIATASLKRPFRLFVPPLATSFSVMLLVSMGLFPTAKQMEALPAHLPAQTVIHQSTWLLQLGDWLGFVVGKLTNAWDWPENLFVNENESYYGAHLWTIQTEFRCSMILFAVLTVLSSLRWPLARHIFAGIVNIYCVFWNRWDVSLFLSGMHLSLINAAQQLGSNDLLPAITRGPPPVYDSYKRSACMATLRRAVFGFYPFILLLAGLWMLSYPEEKADQALGFGFASRLCSNVDFWQSIGAIVVVFSIGKLDRVKSMLSSTPLLYLGALSFSLYLIHYPYLEMVGWNLHLLCREYISEAAYIAGMSTGAGMLIGNLIGFLLVTVGLVWLSDLTMRLVDNPSQRL
ncbi:acyltransferase 3, partial [Bipolaris maydis]